jgi:hypothetical protein
MASATTPYRGLLGFTGCGKRHFLKNRKKEIALGCPQERFPSPDDVLYTRFRRHFCYYCNLACFIHASCIAIGTDTSAIRGGIYTMPHETSSSFGAMTDLRSFLR